MTTADDADYGGSQPLNPSIVYNALKRTIGFSEICRKNKDVKRVLEKTVDKVAHEAFKQLTNSEHSTASMIDSLARLKIQNAGLPGNKLGRENARNLYEQTIGGTYDEIDSTIEYVNHPDKVADTLLDTPHVDVAFEERLFSDTDVHEGDADNDVSGASISIPGPFYLLEYARSPKEFRQALLDSTALSKCRSALECNGFSPQTAGHAAIFLRPEDYPSVQDVIKEWELKPRHIIVAAEFETAVHEALNDIGKGVKIKHSSFVPPAMVKRTFIDVPLPSSMRSEPATRATASTSDGNPRVMLCPRLV